MMRMCRTMLCIVYQGLRAIWQARATFGATCSSRGMQKRKRQGGPARGSAADERARVGSVACEKGAPQSIGSMRVTTPCPLFCVLRCCHCLASMRRSKRRHCHIWKLTTLCFTRMPAVTPCLARLPMCPPDWGCSPFSRHKVEMPSHYPFATAAHTLHSTALWHTAARVQQSMHCTREAARPAPQPQLMPAFAKLAARTGPADVIILRTFL